MQGRIAIGKFGAGPVSIMEMYPRVAFQRNGKNGVTMLFPVQKLKRHVPNI
jgi:hypothetical protein